MKYNEFHRPVSVDFAPRGSACEWCGQPAERQLTAIGGTFHNESGGEQFSEAVTNSAQTLTLSKMVPKTL